MIKRTAYYQVKKVMDEYRIPILVGLRRTGKTTILRQLSEVYEKSIIIRFDSLEIQALNDLNVYNLLKTLINNGYTTLLLDEIQVRDSWDKIAKNLFDEFMYNKKIKVVLTGSSSLSFESKETGVTRTQKVLITTLDFDEYCQLTNKEKSYQEFEHFLGNGGFPEFLEHNHNFEMQRELHLEPIINDDIPKQYKISSGTTSRLLVELATLTNGEFSISKSSINTGISRPQIANYLDILEKCQLIKKVEQVDEEGRFSRYPKYKIYINPHIHLWILGKTFDKLDNSQKGHIIESYWLFAATQINGYYKKFYYLKTKDNKEIDFVTLNSGDQNVKFKTLHEFKYKDSVTTSDVLTMNLIPSINKVLWTKNEAELPGVKVERIIDYKNQID